MTNATPPGTSGRDEPSKKLESDRLGDDAAEVARGQYGLAEEPEEFKAVDLTQTPKDADQKNRDEALEDEVKKTGEDLA
jgi:hypothetical protein